MARTSKSETTKKTRKREEVNEKRMSIRMKVNGDEKFEAKKVFHL